jgi:hypothetical protein
LLRTKYPDLRIEKRLSGTKVDIRFTNEGFAREVWAVECKDYSKRLDKGYVGSEIFPLYHPMLEKREVDRVLIVSRNGLTTDAEEYVGSLKGFSHLTYERLAEALVGLRGYIEHLATLKPTDETDYIEARLEGTTGSALEAVERWICGEGAGQAILGGYGQGKSSFARKLAAHFAARHLKDPTQRMPILLRLGEVVHETQLEGLFGKEFTARHPCPGYQFRTLDHLNRIGRLLIILDGFDEMKHAMTAADFQANFREFNRLLVGDAKVLLLGRPNALPSNERELVFRAKARVGDQVVASSSFAPWPEWRLAFFDERETAQLLSSCLIVFQSRHARDQRFTYPKDFVSLRVAEIFAQVPAELLQRPVHVQLIADVAADPNFDLRGFNEYSLYDHFIRTMVARDTIEKQARRAIPLDARLAFQRELAWWAWRRPDATQGCFFRHDVPAAILRDLPNGNAVDDEGKRNEYIVSTLTEEKESGVLFFAHRSFQEFLVAERMRVVNPTPAAHADYSQYMSEEVSAFLRQAPDQDFILRWHETLQASNGPIALPYLLFFASFPSVLQTLTEELLALDPKEVDLWSVVILHHAAALKTLHHLAPERQQPLMLELVRTGKRETAAAAALSYLTVCEEDNQVALAAVSELTAAILQRCLLAARGDTTNGLTISRETADFASEWATTIIKRHPESPSAGAQLELSVDLEALERLCGAQLQGREGGAVSAGELVNPITMRDVPRDCRGKRVGLLSTQVFRHIPNVLMKANASFLRGRGTSFKVVQVDVRTRKSH